MRYLCIISILSIGSIAASNDGVEIKFDGQRAIPPVSELQQLNSEQRIEWVRENMGATYVAPELCSKIFSNYLVQLTKSQARGIDPAQVSRSYENYFSDEE